MPGEAFGTAPEHVSDGNVFVSYASPDAAVAHAVVAELERHGVACWIAPRDVAAGALYADAIVRAIGGAKSLVVLLSAHAVASPHVGREIERAASKRRPLIALRIDAAPLSPALEYFLGESQWVDAAAGGMDVAMAKLVAAIRSQRGNSPAAIPTPAVAPETTRNRVVLVVVSSAALAILAWFLTDRFWIAKRTAEEKPADTVATAGASGVPASAAIADKSIAVLPFADMSEKKDQEYFADGMAEELLDLLAKIPRLRVIGRTSSFQFKGRNADLRTIGRSLGAAYVVEGSVRKAGNRLRITAQLIGTQDGSHLWSESYDDDAGDALKLQDQIAASVARALQVTVGADDLPTRPMLTRTEAYDRYLRGRYAFDRFDRAGFESAAAYFQQALDLDPALTRAADWLAFDLENVAEWGYVPPAEGFERARRAAQYALGLNARSSMAHSALEAVNLVYDWDWAAAEREGEQARAMEPGSSDAIGGVAQVQAAIGRWDEAVRLVDAALAIDPLFGGWHDILANIRICQGRYVEAEAELRRLLQISPSYASAHYYLGRTLLLDGKLDAALAESQLEAPDSGRDSGLAEVYFAMGRKTESNAALAQLTKARSSDAAFQIAEAHAYRGEVDEALAWLDRAYRQKDIELYWIKGDPLLRNLEGDPRYKALMRKMNLPE